MTAKTPRRISSLEAQQRQGFGRFRSTSAQAIEYGGRIYRRYPDSRHQPSRAYYRAWAPKQEKTGQYLHVAIYEDHFGAVPEGHRVSFADGDFENLDPTNLILRSAAWKPAKNHPWHQKARAGYAQKIASEKKKGT